MKRKGFYLSLCLLAAVTLWLLLMMLTLLLLRLAVLLVILSPFLSWRLSAR